MTKTDPIFKILNAGAKPPPVVFDNPHSGTALPDHFRYDCPRQALNHVSDLHMEKLLRDIVSTPVLEAQIHRACIDMNRFADELDPRELRDGWNAPYRLSRNTDKGFGLFLRDLYIGGHLRRVYNDKARPPAQEIKNRIALYHEPYYKALEDLLDRAHDHHGYCVHINMHSMVRPDPASTDIILGDLFGTACHHKIGDFAAAFFSRAGLSVSFNAPYSGGALVKTTHDPAQGRHSLQIEIARDLYMDSKTLAYQPQKAARLEQLMKSFADELQDFCTAHAQELKALPGPHIGPFHGASNGRDSLFRPHSAF